MPGMRDAPDVITHPPFLYLGGLFLGLALDWAWPQPFLPAPIQYGVGGALIAVSFVPAGWAFARFIGAGTNIPTNRPTTALVTSGPYRFSRNPIYVGMTLVYLGLALVIDSAWILAGIVPILLAMRYGVIAREERYLEAKFGELYRAYKSRVRRWL